MSTSALEKLMFTVGITDMVKQPAMSINKTISGMKHNATSGFDAIRGGMFGLAGAGIAVKTFMQPVYDVEEALGEVRSLGVIESELETLTRQSLKFSVAYGESASDFIKSSYDIQSAIGGLTNGELAEFTNASNILAKGTKADAGTITNYMGTMYGIFKDQANSMGKAEWVKQLTGQTAEAVKMFKTDGQQMSAAFSSIGANAASSGVAISEQMAVLGTLQSTMSGSEAGTKYKAFLAGVVGAQDKLGLSFTDSNNRLLPMVDILNKIKGRFGVLDELEKADLKTAFGSGEALDLVTQLMGKTDGLADSMNALGNIKGMKNAEIMAKAMVDPWEQFKSVTEAVRIGFGKALMPTINDLLQTMIGGLSVLTGWTQEFPNITKWVGMAVLGILALSAATGLFSIVMGIGKTAMAAWGIGVLIFKGLIFGLTFVFNMLTLSVAKLGIAMIMNPMGLMIVAVVALIAVVAALAYWWSDLYDMFADTTFGAAVIQWFSNTWEIAKGLFSWLGEAWTKTAALFSGGDFGSAFSDWSSTMLSGFKSLLSFIFPWWGKVTEMFSVDNFGQGILDFFDAFKNKFDGVKDFFGMGEDGAEISSGADSALNTSLPGTVPQNLSSAPDYNLASMVPQDLNSQFNADLPDIVPQDLNRNLNTDLPDIVPQNLNSHLDTDSQSILPKNLSVNLDEDLPGTVPQDLNSNLDTDVQNILPKNLSVNLDEYLPGTVPQNLSSVPDFDFKNDTASVAGLDSMRAPVENKDGLAKQLANAMGSGGNSFGDVHINAENGMSPEALEEWGMMQGG